MQSGTEPPDGQGRFAPAPRTRCTAAPTGSCGWRSARHRRGAATPTTARQASLRSGQAAEGGPASSSPPSHVTLFQTSAVGTSCGWSCQGVFKERGCWLVRGVVASSRLLDGTDSVQGFGTLATSCWSTCLQIGLCPTGWAKRSPLGETFPRQLVFLQIPNLSFFLTEGSAMNQQHWWLLHEGQCGNEESKHQAWVS